MARVRVDGFTISLDGLGVGPNQDIRNPLGVGGEDLRQWLLPTRTFQRTLFGADGGTTCVDDEFAARGFKNVGAWILGRNMFGPIRGAWPDMDWKGWWGDNPPYHVPTFILTHHQRSDLQMEGGTMFHFVTGGIREALDRARDTAGGMDVLIDCESLYNLIYRRHPVHAFFHTYVGATLVVAAIVLLFLGLRTIASRFRLPDLFRWRGLSARQVAVGAALGACSHVALDSIMHSDIQPLAPFSFSNVLLGFIPVGTLHLACIVLGALGCALVVIRRFGTGGENAP